MQQQQPSNASESGIRERGEATMAEQELRYPLPTKEEKERSDRAVNELTLGQLLERASVRRIAP